MVINDRSPIRVNGAILAEYPALTDDNPYVFSRKDDRPWNADANNIKSVRFGSSVAPTSLNFWFQDIPVESIDWNNCDTTKIESARAALSGVKLVNVTLPPMPALTNLRFMFANSSELKTADLSKVNAESVTDINSLFKNCGALEVADISGLHGVVAEATQAFSNNTASSPDMSLKTIYAAPDLDCSSATGTNMFRGCVDLIGGSGTVYTYDHRTNEYARIDEPEIDKPGYFTAKTS